MTVDVSHPTEQPSVDVHLPLIKTLLAMPPILPVGRLVGLKPGQPSADNYARDTDQGRGNCVAHPVPLLKFRQKRTRSYDDARTGRPS
jgi:hypothetical protein